jgi:phospholipid/cholesterol/gamma-HCH transport system substrate-binding protein
VRGVASPLIKLAIFTVVTLLSVAVLLTTVQNTYFGSTESYKARFTDASGLIQGSDVRIAGVRVGQVTDVELVDRQVAEVSFKVDESRRIPAASIFSIKYQNLVGQRYLEIARGNGPMNAMLPPDATVPVSQTRPPLNLTVVFNGFKPLFQALNPNDINQLSFEIIQVLQGQGATVNSLLARTASLTSTIADRDQVIGSLITNLNTVLDTVNARDDRLSGLIVSLQQLVSGLAQDRVAIGSTLQTIADLTTTTAGLLNDARPPLRDDIVRLGQLSANLNRNRGQVENFLRLTPQKANNFGRAGSYGSWFNFYLCGLGGTLNFGGQPISSVPVLGPLLPDPDGAGPLKPGDFSLPLPDTAGRCNG